ncbi:MULTISPECIES: DUF1887 family CARF protein [Spirulina sp. CCY15215]|uniref:Card1-like endonuclease domain-containing protein n=1 Tax=Spirulina sp. CCY15215 TaxID=2767591 RepID=UPI00194EF0C3|nr:DUF1887 family CARF protein [Spirulina major]
MANLEKYQVDHLFLLIGENPLPNYVAAKLLLNKGGFLYLVHTSGTNAQAIRLRKILDREIEDYQPSQLVSLEDYDSDAYRIQRKILEQVESLKDGKVGMNYTGGTKAMAVHAYRAMLQATQNKGQEAVFSYLDPRRLEMCIDREDGDRIRIKIEPKTLSVDLKIVFELHAWSLVSKPSETPIHPSAAEKFAKFHAREDYGKHWRKWCDNTLRDLTKSKKGGWPASEQELKQVEPLELDSLESYSDIKSALSCLGVTENTLSIQSLNGQEFKKLKHICKWLDGEWLEHYVLHKIKEISNEKEIHDSAVSFNMAVAGSKENKFEFDVAFMRGYQLFAISCTADSTKHLCKQKLFEAYIRARQLGGDEARVALVCCASQKDILKLRTEITNVLQSSPSMSSHRDSKIVVLGREDLLDLPNKISEWIDENDWEVNQ